MSAKIPSISIAASDFTILKKIAARALEERHPVGGFLAAELARADVPESSGPLRCVRLNDWVTFRADDGLLLESRLLVSPENFRNNRLHLSVLSPLGAALLGLHVGSRMPYVGADGTPHIVTVESLDPPEGVVSLHQYRITKIAPRLEGRPDQPGPTAA